MRAAGVKRGDRVGGVLPNIPESVVAMLATTSIGALWSSCSPDFGLQGVRDRFGQIEPKVVFISDGYFFKGKRIDSMAKLAPIVESLPSIQQVVVVRYTVPEHIKLNITAVRNGVHFSDFVKLAGKPTGDGLIQFEQVPFSHPVYVMYRYPGAGSVLRASCWGLILCAYYDSLVRSSGTTGLPKCIVQGAGVALNHMKEQVLHCNLTREDVLYYFTTTGWMMWNWLVSGLATGCTVVLFDGNPLYPDAGALWRMAEELRINLFGCSARYLQAVQDAGCVPKREFDLSSLRCIMSTGSPATVNTFDFIYKSVANVQFASISGGTDLNGCFALGCPVLPVYSPELQCRGLGMKVKVYNEQGKECVGQTGELVRSARLDADFVGSDSGAVVALFCFRCVRLHSRPCPYSSGMIRMAHATTTRTLERTRASGATVTSPSSHHAGVW